jgi:hypothetical protein
MADDPRFITAERWAEIVATADIPEALRDHLSGKVEPDGLVHWRGADQQEVVFFFGVHRPSRCGRFADDTMGYPLRYVTCPKCLELAEADGVPALIERQRAEILDAFEIPQQLRDAWREIKES